MNNELISIIIPVYNVEKYIRKCLDSILDQTYTNWECILVDDGSPDNAGKICEEYANKYNRFKVIHKDNAGVTEARITGLQNSLGNYVAFIDSDDYVSPNYIETLYDCIKDNNALVACCQDIVVYANGEERMDVRSEFGLFDRERLIKVLGNNFLYDSKLKKGGLCFCGLWGKLFNKSLLVGNAMNMAKGIWMGEDCVTLVYVLNKLPTVYVSDKYLYYYVQHKEQATRRFDLNTWNNMVLHFCKIAEIDTDKHFEDQLPYKVFAFLKRYIEYSVNNIKSHKDFKAGMKSAMQPHIVQESIINYNYKVLTTHERLLIMMLKKQCYMCVFLYMRIISCVRRICKK